MRSPEYAPFFRSTVGFDRLFDMLENSVRTDWPPYDIEKKSEHAYRITMALAGFGPEEIDLTQHGPDLIVTGKKAPEQDGAHVLHRGLAHRSFKQVFRLADHVKVAKASLENGLLSVDLVREIPEEMKPRRIAVTTAAAGPSAQDPGKVDQITQDLAPQAQAA